MGLSIYLNGASGRMGQILTALAEKDLSLSLKNNLEEADVVIDFSAPEALFPLVEQCKIFRKPLVVGTTGHLPEAILLLELAAQQIPVLFSPNYSLGFAVCLEAAHTISTLLGETCDVAIVEAHHTTKKDQPSGTALALAKATKRPEAPIHAIRAGDIIGDHMVHFILKGERIELRHTVQSRDAFARGALLGAKFLHFKAPGLYSIKDILYATRQS